MGIILAGELCLFFYISFNMSLGGNWMTLQIPPPFVGYLLIAYGLYCMKAFSPRFRNAMRAALALGLWYAAMLVITIILLPAGIGNTLTVLTMLVSFGAIYVDFQIVRGVGDLERSMARNLREKPLFILWLLNAGAALLMNVVAPLRPQWSFSFVLLMLALRLGFLWMLGRTYAAYKRAVQDRHRDEIALQNEDG